jgi:5,5'-dehydrodivanillate O-demethylase
MPNINYIMSGSPGTESVAGSDSLFIRVPVDDEHHLHFGLVWANTNKGQEKKAYSVDGSERIKVDDKERSELVDAVLAGKIHIDEIAYPERARHPDRLTDIERFWVQDNIAMLGQGVQWDRKNEHLGREDAAVILMRKLWARELDALTNGRPLKEWRRPPEMFPSVAALPHAQR